MYVLDGLHAAFPKLGTYTMYLKSSLIWGKALALQTDMCYLNYCMSMARLFLPSMALLPGRIKSGNYCETSITNVS
jgi:hypothetical protein